MDVVHRDALVPLYVQVKRKLQAAILDGTFTDAIPSERQLARQYDIAQMTARRAVMELVGEGVLYRRVGRGTFVCKPGTAARRTYAIGFALHPAVAGGPSNPYFAGVLRGAEAAARKQGYAVMFTSAIAELIEAADDGRRNHPGRKVDGVLAVALDDERAVRRAGRIVPVVVLDNEFDRIDCVVADNVAGGRIATQHLVELGHTKVAHLAGPRSSAVGRDRLAGYRQAMAEAHLACDRRQVVRGAFDLESGYAAAGRLMSRRDRPTAIFCANDAIALGAMKRLRELHLSVPGDVSLVGFDDIDPAAMVDPALTTVRVPRERIGGLAAEVLLSLIEAPGEPARAGKHVVDVSLVERASCRRL